MKKLLVFFAVSLFVAFTFNACEKDNEDGKSAAYEAGKASGEKFCACLDTVSDPLFGSLTCLIVTAEDGIPYVGTADTTDFANGYAAGAANCTQ